MWKIEKIVKKGDYNYAVVKNHPHATKHGYVLHHRVVMENFLGRLLYPKEIVHHKDGNKKRNIPSNLEVTNPSLHSKMHGEKVGRKWVSLKCPECKIIFEKEKRSTYLNKSNKYSCTCCSHVCKGKFHSRIQFHGLTPELERAISENLLLEYRKYSKDNAEETETTGSVETIRTSSEMVKT